MHSSGNISALRTSMARPCHCVCSRNPGTVVSITCGSQLTSADGTASPNSLIQKLVIPVRTRPFSGIASSMTTSKALSRSEATIKR